MKQARKPQPDDTQALAEEAGRLMQVVRTDPLQGAGVNRVVQASNRLTQIGDELTRELVVGCTLINALVDKWTAHHYRPTLQGSPRALLLADIYDFTAARRGLDVTAYRGLDAKPSAAQAIDMRMTWGEAARLLLAVLEDGTAKGKREARIEIMKMARAADVAKGAAELVDRFLKIDDWSDESIAPKELIADARDLQQQLGRSA